MVRTGKSGGRARCRLVLDDSCATYCAFGFAAALTIVGSFTALYEFNAIGEITSEILSYSFPATVVSLRLAEEASSLVSSAPRLMAAVDDKTRLDTANGVGRQAKSLEEGITRLRELGIGTADEIDTTRKALVQRLDALDQAVKDRIIISNERRYMASSVRKAHEGFLVGLAPAIDDANFDLMMRSKTATVDPKLSSDLEALRGLLEIRIRGKPVGGPIDGSIAGHRSNAARTVARFDWLGKAENRDEFESDCRSCPKEESDSAL